MTWNLTPELEETILEQLENGISLVKICQQEGVPSRRTVLRWQRELPGFGTKCAHAREAQGDLAADKLDDLNDKVEQGALGPAAASVISANLKWKAAKLNSKQYGDSAQIKLADADGGKLTLLSILSDIDGTTANLPTDKG